MSSLTKDFDYRKQLRTTSKTTMWAQHIENLREVLAPMTACPSAAWCLWMKYPPKQKGGRKGHMQSVWMTRTPPYHPPFQSSFCPQTWRHLERNLMLSGVEAGMQGGQWTGRGTRWLFLCRSQDFAEAIQFLLSWCL